MHKIGLLTLSLLFIGCQKNSETIEYKGIGEKQAVQLLVRAQSAKQQTSVIERIRRDSRHGFAWESFWNEIRRENLLHDLEPQVKGELLGLVAESCSEPAYEAFAKLIFTQVDRHDLLLNVTNQCSFALSDQLYLDYFTFYRGKVIAGEASSFEPFSQLVSRQMQAGEATLSLRNSFDSVAPAQWSQIIENGFEKARAEASMELIDAYEKVYGSYELADVLLKPALSSPDEFATLMKSFGFGRTLDLLQRVPENYFTSLADQKINLEIPLTLIVQTYSQQQYRPLNTFSLAEQAYRDFLSIAHIIQRAESNLSYQTIFDWSDGMFSTLERWIKTDRLSQIYDRFEPSVFLLWTRYRLGEELTERKVVETVKNQSTVSPWREALEALLLIHVQNNQELAHQQVQQFCAKLNDLGVPSRQVPITQFSADTLKTPGCVEVTETAEDSIINIEVESLDMNLATVLSTSGASLSINAKTVDASIIDLTNTQTHPDLPAEATPTESNAVVFPVLLGLQILNDTGIYGPGFYYMLSHFTWRKAATGAAATAQPLTGFPGGDLNIQAETSTPFQAVSLGGDGQKAAPPLTGGSADVSVIDPSNVSLEFSSLAGVLPARRLLVRPDVRAIKHLLQFAERTDENKIRVYADTEIWWRNLNAEQKQKVSVICNSEIPDQECSHRLAEQAIIQLVTEITAESTNLDQNSVLDRLASTTYHEFKGSPGPINPSGERGASGTIQTDIQGEQE